MKQPLVGRPKAMRWARTAVLLVLAPLASFYLFVVPLLVAEHPKELGALGLAFAAFMLAQLLMIATESAYGAAARFYGVKRPRLFRFMDGPFLGRKMEPAPGSPFSMFISYVLLNYAFAVIYVFLSHVDHAAFSTGRPLELLDAFYFSTVTAATIGYGDISPTAVWPRVVVTIQVYVSLLYAVLLFGACSSYLVGRRTSDSTPADDAGSNAPS